MSILRALYPFQSKLPADFWRDKANHARYMALLGQKLGFEGPDHWYNISSQHFFDNGGKILLYVYYGNSPQQAVMQNFADHDWLPWKFRYVPKKFFQNPKNREKFMQRLAMHLGYTGMSSWYNIEHQQILDFGGGALLDLHEHSAASLVMATFPHHTWEMWKFSCHSLWKSAANRLMYMTHLGARLGYQKMEDWYSISSQDLGEVPGLLQLYSGSAVHLVISVFNEHHWESWKFRRKSNVWNDKHNQEQFLLQLGSKMNIQSMEDWYKISRKNLLENGGAQLLEIYNGSPQQTIMGVFDRHEWIPWKFQRTARNFFASVDNTKKYVKYLEEKLNISSHADWYRVSLDQLAECGSNTSFLLHYNKQLYCALSAVYPEHHWDSATIIDASNKRSSQYKIISKLKEVLLPKETEIFSEYNVKNELTGEQIQVDIFVPHYKLCIEYQGAYHYRGDDDSCKYGIDRNPKTMAVADNGKRIKLQQMRYSFVELPYWWDNKEDTLAKILRRWLPKEALRWGSTT